MAKKVNAEDFMKMFEGGGQEPSSSDYIVPSVPIQRGWDKKRGYQIALYPQTREVKLKALTQITNSKSDSMYLEELINREYEKYFGKKEVDR